MCQISIRLVKQFLVDWNASTNFSARWNFIVILLIHSQSKSICSLWYLLLSFETYAKQSHRHGVAQSQRDRLLQLGRRFQVYFSLYLFVWFEFVDDGCAEGISANCDCSKSRCPFCVDVKKLLTNLGATYKAIELDTEGELFSNC